MNIINTPSSWFFKEAPVPLRFLHIYIRGDAIVLLPFIGVLLLVGLFSLRWMALLFGIFSAFRSLGEMVYWIHQQFGNKSYRPYDFGFHKLDNHAVYILYQLISLVLLVVSTGFVVYLLLGWN